MRGMRILIILFLAVFIYSCKSRTCENENLKTIQFHNVTENELQNVRIIGYKKNGEFNQIKDTGYKIVAMEFGAYDGHTHIATLNKDLNLDLDYKIVYEDFQDSCMFTDIIHEQWVCKQIILFKENAHEIDGYKMNGKPFACDVLKAFPTRSP